MTVTKVTSPIVAATRTIVSLLPNAAQKVLTPLADFVFRGFGLATGLAGNKATVHFTGLSAGIQVRPSDLIAYSDRAIRHEASNITSGANFQSNIASVRILNIKVRASNVAASSGKRGQWAMCLVWISTEADDAMWKEKQMTFRDIADIPGAVVASCCTELVMVAKPRPHTFAANGVGLTDNVANLYIAFECLDRTAYTEFTSDDFGCTLSVSGTFKVSEWMPNNMPMTYYYNIRPIYASNTALVEQDNRERYICTIASCKPATDGSGCLLTGEFKKVLPPTPRLLSLERMAID